MEVEEITEKYRNTWVTIRELSEQYKISKEKISKILKDKKIEKDRIGIVKREFEKAGYILLTKEYTNNHTKIQYICGTHGLQTTTWRQFKDRPRCPKCKESSSTYYNKALAERNKDEWLKVSAKLYLVEFRNKKEHFLKLGVTKNGIEKRLGVSDYFGYERVSTELFRATLYDVVCLEQKLLKKYRKKYRYCPEEHFTGHTECLDLECKNSLRLEIQEELEDLNSQRMGKMTERMKKKLKIQSEIFERYQNTWVTMTQLSKEYNIPVYDISVAIREANVKKDKIGIISRELKKQGYQLITTEYKNNQTLLKYICPTHGLQETNYRKITRGYGCNSCATEERGWGYNKTYTEVKNKFEDKGYKLITQEYVSSKGKLEYICPKHGLKETTYNKISQGYGCAECGFESGAKLRRKAYADVKKEFEKRGYELLTLNYENAEQNLTYLCPKHGEQTITYANLSQGVGCIECAREGFKGENNINQKRGYEVIKKIFEAKGCTLITREYENRNSILKYYCPEHGYQETTYPKMKQRKSCCGKDVIQQSKIS